MNDPAMPFKPADPARVVKEGPWLGKRGIIKWVDPNQGLVVLFFDHFGRIVPCELECSGAEKLAPDDWDENLERIRAHLFDADESH